MNSSRPSGPGTLPADPRPGPPGADGLVALPVLRHRRDGILPAIAAALSVRGTTLTSTASKADEPPALHPLVQDCIDSLGVELRVRAGGRCPETVLLSRFLTGVDQGRSKRAARKPLAHGEARRALKHARITARHIREDGDPQHGTYAPPCRTCDAVLAHFGVRAVDPGASPDRS